MGMTTGDWLARARAALEPVAGAQAAREARLILSAVTGWSAARVAVAQEEALTPDAVDAAEAMVVRRLAREPLAQILGEWPFYGRGFVVTRDTLTPRPDTETLVDLALAEPFLRLVDLGTGTGAIGVTLLAERSQATGVATDLSPGAVSVAARNAARHGVEKRLELRQADWWQGIEGRFDLIVSNPPYVTEAEYAGLAPEITAWEPRAALTPGGDGLAAYRAILGGVTAHLEPGGRVLVEIGEAQGTEVAALFMGAGLDAVAVHADINGKARVVSGRSPDRAGCG